MSRIFLFFVILVAVSGSKHHPKFRRNEEIEGFKKVGCTDDGPRNELIQKSLCGAPKDVFVEIKHGHSFLQVSPNFVWLKRCVGVCTSGTTCVSTFTKMESIPVRVYNAKTKKEYCATYDMEVHESCGCCDTTVEDCTAVQIFNHRKCSCQCPNTEERRKCLRKRQQMNHRTRWNRSKCACETRKSIR